MAATVMVHQPDHLIGVAAYGLTALVACATALFVTGVLGADNSIVPPVSQPLAAPPQAAHETILGFPRDLVQVYARYEKAFASHDFPALKGLLAPDFATFQPGRGFSGHDELGWQGHDKSLRDLREMFELGRAAPRSGRFRDSVRLERVSVAGMRASVWLRQVLGFNLPGRPSRYVGQYEYHLREDWVRTAAGWRLRRIAPRPEEHVTVSLTLY